jgi:hypothetical protein
MPKTVELPILYGLETLHLYVRGKKTTKQKTSRLYDNSFENLNG